MTTLFRQIARPFYRNHRLNIWEVKRYAPRPDETALVLLQNHRLELSLLISTDLVLKRGDKIALFAKRVD